MILPEFEGVEHLGHIDLHEIGIFVVEGELGVEESRVSVVGPLATGDAGPHMPQAIDVGVMRVENGVECSAAEVTHIIEGVILGAQNVGIRLAHPRVYGAVRLILERPGALAAVRSEIIRHSHEQRRCGRTHHQLRVLQPIVLNPNKVGGFGGAPTGGVQIHQEGRH